MKLSNLDDVNKLVRKYNEILKKINALYNGELLQNDSNLFESSSIILAFKLANGEVVLIDSESDKTFANKEVYDFLRQRAMQYYLQLEQDCLAKLEELGVQV